MIMVGRNETEGLKNWAINKKIEFLICNFNELLNNFQSQ